MDWAEGIAKQIIKFPDVSNYNRLYKEIAEALRKEREDCANIAYHYEDGDNARVTANNISHLIRDR